MPRTARERPHTPISDRLRGTLIPAVPVPFGPDGEPRRDAQRAYAAWMSRQPVGGVAVWAHTGRGLDLDPEQRAAVIDDWRAALGDERIIVAGCGVPRRADGTTALPSSPAARTDAVIERTLAVALEARRGGANALLVHPPSALAALPDRQQRIVAVHDALQEVALPVIAFLLYDRASGLEYDDPLLDALLTRPHVIGVKVATLDSVMRFQDVAARMRCSHPDRLLITGEDRFLGYSLQLGATSALIGMGAACTRVQAELVHAARDGDASRVIELGRLCDALAAATFVAPMEGYIRRMLWALREDDVLPEDACHDRFGPPLADSDRVCVAAAVRALRDAGW